MLFLEERLVRSNNIFQIGESVNQSVNERKGKKERKKERKKAGEGERRKKGKVVTQANHGSSV